MHPNAFLSTLWRAEVQNTVFVAMSFDPRFDARFRAIIKPAIESEPIAGQKLVAHRVDTSKSGDSILTEIVTGIAHARLVLADVSVIDEGRYTQVPIRNANVMYEVGIALACRTPPEVVLVRDDTKPLLFDLSTIPTLLVDFENPRVAIEALRTVIADRLTEISLVEDARVRQAVQGLTPNELKVLQVLSALPDDRAQDLSHPTLGQLSMPTEKGLAGLLQRGFARSVAINTKTGSPFYQLTPIGKTVASAVVKSLKNTEPDQAAENDRAPKEPGAA